MYLINRILQRRKEYEDIVRKFDNLQIQIYGLKRLLPELWNVIYESFVALLFLFSLAYKFVSKIIPYASHKYNISGFK